MGEEGGFQAGPVVIGDTMFVTTAHTTVALNAGTCGLIWRHIDSARADDPFPVNRGVAYLDGRIYRGSPGGRLVALSSSTGELVWEQKIANGGVGEFLSSAPIAWDGKVFIGLAGGDWGIRGAMMAFDAATGAQSWKFYTVPMGEEEGAETWKIPETAHRGGGAMWTLYTLDESTGEVFVPVGNPAPDQRLARHLRHQGQPQGRGDGSRRFAAAALQRGASGGQRQGAGLRAAAGGAGRDGFRVLLRCLPWSAGRAGSGRVGEANRGGAGGLRPEPDRRYAEAVPHAAGRRGGRGGGDLRAAGAAAVAGQASGQPWCPLRGATLEGRNQTAV